MAESLPKGVKNTVEKGEIAGYEQILFSNSAIKRLSLKTRKNQGLFGKGLSTIQLTWHWYGAILGLVLAGTTTSWSVFEGEEYDKGFRLKVTHNHVSFSLVLNNLDLIHHFETVPNAEKLQLKCGY